MILLALGLQARGHLVSFVLHRKGPLSEYLEKSSISYSIAPKVHIIAGGSIVGQIIKMSRAAFRLTPFLRQKGVTIVHTNDARMHFTWGLSARLAGVAFIWHQRSAVCSRRVGIFSKLAHAFLTISEYCRMSYAGTASSRARPIYDPFEVMAEAPDRNQARAALLTEWDGREDVRIVGYVGNLTEQKRPDMFIEMAARLNEAHPASYIFPMFGELRDGFRERLEEQISAEGLTDCCRLMGPRYPIEPYIAGFDVLVAPAVAEGLGRTLVEAMMVGTPVVAGKDGGHCEVIEHEKTGFLTDPDNSKAFAENVCTVLAEPANTQRMAEAAVASVRERFSVEKHVTQIEAVYEQVT